MYETFLHLIIVSQIIIFDMSKKIINILIYSN